MDRNKVYCIPRRDVHRNPACLYAPRKCYSLSHLEILKWALWFAVVLYTTHLFKDQYETLHSNYNTVF